MWSFPHCSEFSLSRTNMYIAVGTLMFHLDGLVQDCSPLLTHWSYCSLALSHRFDDASVRIEDYRISRYQHVEVDYLRRRSSDFKGNRSLAISTCIMARASRTCRDVCRDRWPTVTGIRSQHSRRMRNPQFTYLVRVPLNCYIKYLNRIISSGVKSKEIYSWMHIYLYL